VLLSELPPVDKGTRAREVASLFGLCPRIQESGTSVRGARLSGQGRRVLSHQLYMPALVAMKHNPVVRQWTGPMALRGKAGKQIVAAAIHKLLRLAVGVLKTQTSFTPGWKGALA
jgi:transposase